MPRGCSRAREAGIETVCLSPRDYAGPDVYDQAIVDVLRARDVDLVCLAGFMRLVGRPLLEAFPDRILNIHPSLLPAFPGLDAQRQALEHGVRVAGATVHLVTAELDGGPIVLQAAVPVLDDDTVETLVGAHPGRGAPALSRGDRDRPRGRLASRRSPVRPPRPAKRGIQADSSVSSATSGGQLMRTGT